MGVVGGWYNNDRDASFDNICLCGFYSTFTSLVDLYFVLAIVIIICCYIILVGTGTIF
jgi:hypothetical protein